MLLNIFSFIFGTLVGSFLNVLILRLPKNEDVVFKRSHCLSCNHQIKWFENIPILSFLFLKGKCSSCETKISFQYPIVELFVGIVFLLLTPSSLEIKPLLNYLFYVSVISAFFVHFVIDLRHKILPDSINIFLGLLFLIFSLVNYHWTHLFFGGLIGFGFPLLVTWFFYKFRGVVGLGGGDIKLFGILGFILGPMGIIHNIFFSCFLGSILGGAFLLLTKNSHKEPIPFGPFIIVVAVFQIFYVNSFQKLINILF